MNVIIYKIYCKIMYHSMTYLKILWVKNKYLLQIPNAVTACLYLMYFGLLSRAFLFLMSGDLDGEEERPRLQDLTLLDWECPEEKTRVSSIQRVQG